MKRSKRVTFKFDKQSLTTVENMAEGDEWGELQEITVTTPETGKVKVFIPWLAPPKKCPHCGKPI